ncbi:uncharacterized protein KY384_007894 [Bacidia gigantensis]|uniref:uncharacterized protein n=1 Tax=Bacidia gigantensis TaxID=2732470 RepID=UPI001D03FD44|nr:uncharacterized protein KY384_007894 [Bacidia gigantensis]KAG8527740.1 hypothetical protein KY384_007894 [Bacidia gigantensis]
MYQYSVPPPGYVRYDYTTSASTSPSGSPSPEAAYTYYIPPQYKSPPPTKDYKKHSRSQSYSTPKRPGGWHAPAEFPSSSYYARQPDFASPPAKYQEHVSSRTFSRAPPKPQARRDSATADPRGGGNWTGSHSYNDQFGHRGETRPQRHASTRSPQQKQHIIIDTSDSADDSPTFTYIKPRKPEKQLPKPKKTNNHFFFTQAPRNDSQQKSSTRRASAARPSSSNKPAKQVDPPRQATPADALKHRIPAGYSLKNWDPDEAPVMLLGSVFDANSLGKWIYDWTVYHHGASTPMSEVAGDMWLLLIKLAHKMKRADAILPKVEDDNDYDLVEEFLDSGDRLWHKLKKLLKQCEEFMWKVAKKEGEKDGGAKGSYKMGKNSGCEFVDSMFGRDRMLEDTEDMMQRIRLWNMRFDANCEDVIRNPRG